MRMGAVARQMPRAERVHSRVIRFQLTFNPGPQGTKLFGSLSVGRKLGDGEPNAKSVLMIVSLHDVGKRKYTDLIQSCGGFTRAAGASWGLVENKGKILR